ncbi:MAG TPA: excinuclease ABC subunit UvrA [Candidatus Saccharibacteria bacterium]|nr:excinuclease ABC subunit UvrA [Candidatus Saccharibacteria bacterium]HMT39855.1 excinuclease ABC subunit UvrA [Candidatus Saccharibacteria bacterium]
MAQHDKIIIKGAREHNLKNIDVEIPRDKLVVITGLSGSGKSSLAFDTIYAEGQRRYVESLSAYARQFLGLMEKPDVDQIDGLSPAISIDQKSSSRNPRSTVATVTEIYDYLRLLFARIGIPHDPDTGEVLTRQTPQQIVDIIKQYPKDTKIIVLAPIVKDKKGEHRHLLEEAQKAGYTRVRLDGRIYEIDEVPAIDRNKKHTIEIAVDRINIDAENPQRLVESVEAALHLGEGVINILNFDTNEEKLFSEHYTTVNSEYALPEIEPRLFSFNSPHGACPKCMGLGSLLIVDPDLIVPNKKLSIAEGAIRPWSRTTQRLSWYTKLLEAVAKLHNFNLNVPVEKLSKSSFDIICYGTGDQEIGVPGPGGKIYRTKFEGVIPNLERRYRESDSDFVKKEIEKYMTTQICTECNGKRLKPEVLAITIKENSIADITELTVEDALDYFSSLKLVDQEATIANQILKEINARLKFLNNVGLSYLSLNRAANTLAGGEAQRIRLATQIGSSLMGVLYILDEPSIGLHQRDNDRLIETLNTLRNLGNTVIVVEHDEDTIKAADYVIDIGPLAGEEGGKVVAAGSPSEVQKVKESLTGQYLSGTKKIEIPKNRRKPDGRYLEIIDATEHNLKNVNVKIPLGIMTVVTGVSGSGKSSLINDILARKLSQEYHRSQEPAGKFKQIKGTEYLDKVIDIDQSPIGRTPRSNTATYTGTFNDIRDLFAMVPEAKIRGYSSGRFSFNVKGGRCENCKGDGIIKIEMHFLPDVYVTCESCHGKRYNREALEILYKGKNISDVLDMTVEKACEFFANIPSISRKLETLRSVGLSYIKLGQPATTLSGGEAQRIKLASELSRRATGKTLYILDEPTTGLHFEDVKKLLEVLQALVSLGNSVLIIEHNLDVVKSSDWVIDLGPEGGSGGGQIIGSGTPEQIAKIKGSYTGQYLKKIL